MLFRSCPGHLLLMFVLAADLLQSFINDAMQPGSLIRALPIQCSPDFSVVQYADDTLIIMQAVVPQLLFLKDLMLRFGEATG